MKRPQTPGDDGENIIELFREKDFPATTISNIGSEFFEDSGVKSGIEFEVFGEILRITSQ